MPAIATAAAPEPRPPRTNSRPELHAAGVQLLATPADWAETENRRTWRLRCYHCGEIWCPYAGFRGRLEDGYWKCPRGCNAPPAAAARTA